MKYFSEKISKGFISIYSSRVIIRIAASLMGLFLPIFLYELFNYNVEYVIYYYMTGYILYMFFVAGGVKFLNKIGLRRSIKISIIWLALFYFCFYFLDRLSLDFYAKINSPAFLILISSILLLTLHRIMYWTPLHTDIAKFTNKKNRGRELSLLESTTVFLTAVMPLIAGWIIWQYSYEILFLIAIVIYLFSILPLLYLPRTKEKFSWSYFETWKEFFSKKRRGVVLAFMNDGAENAFTIIIWPIFIFKLLEGNYFEAGLITSLVVFVTVILQLIVGKNLDIKDKKNILKHGTWFYSLGWVIKIFISSAFHIFIVSTYHSLSRIFTRTPFDSLVYEKAADQGHFVDEFTVIHEMAIGLGRIVILSLVLLLLPYIGLKWTFIFAALTTLGMNFMTEDHIIENGRHAG